MLVGKSSFCTCHSIQEAIDLLEQPEQINLPAILYVMEGIYEEQVTIYRSQLHIIGIGNVTITAKRYAKELDEHGEEIGTFATPTLFIGGSGVTVENLTICNTAGQGKEIGQAVAATVYGDKIIFRNCKLKGHQDTLFTGPLPPKPKERKIFGGVMYKENHEAYRQWYDHCYIEGTVDFIFGGATAYFDHCQIHSLRLIDDHASYVTAASTPEGQEFGYIFRSCYLTADEGVKNVFLGRPWRQFAKTMFIDCYMDTHIHPEGWDNWDNADNESTVSYSEYNTRLTDGSEGEAWKLARVKWADSYTSGGEDFTKEVVFANSDFWRK